MNVTASRIRIVEGSTAVQALLASLPDDMRTTPFQHPNWITAWFAVDGRADRRTIAAVVECAATGRPWLVLPLVLDTLGAATHWAPLDFGVCDYNGSYTAPDFRPSAAEMRVLWARLVAVLPADATFLVIDKIAAEIGHRHDPLLDLPGLRPSHVIRHPLTLDADFATLRATRFCQTMARSLERKRRKLERKGAFAFTVATGPEAVPLLDRLMVWRDERWGARPVITDFYRRLVAAGDPVRVMALTLDGEPIAACFGACDASGFRLLAVAHDDAFKNWSPGLLVIEDAIAWAVGQGFGEFDFTIGSEAYKFDFGVHPEPLWFLTEEFSPHGSAMLRLLLTRNLIASKLKRFLHVHGPRRRHPKAAAG